MIIITSCDPVIGYRYTVNNKSDKELKVYFQVHNSDSTTFIQPRTKVDILEIETWGSNPHDEKDNFLNVTFDSINIEAVDNTKLEVDFRKRENWIYEVGPGKMFLINTGLNIYGFYWISCEKIDCLSLFHENIRWEYIRENTITR